jgi:hypothetical protein
MKKFYKGFILSVLGFAFIFMIAISNTTLAATKINLGTAGDFSVLGASTVTNTGSTIVNGDLGLSPGTSVTGFPPGIVNGVQHITDGSASIAQSDLVTAYNQASGATGAIAITGDLGGKTLTPGVYGSASAVGLTGTLTLDGLNDLNSVFIFQVGSALTTASGSNINLINGAQACNIFWQISSSATLGTNSNFAGNILAFSSVTVNTGATVNGRVLARNGAVTLDTSPISKPSCQVPVVVTVDPVVVTPTPTIPTPDPIITPVIIPVPTIIPDPIIDPIVTIVSTIIPTSNVQIIQSVPGLPITGFNEYEDKNFITMIFKAIHDFFKN